MCTYLITGGTGSFGQQCAKTLLAEHDPKKVIILSRDELKQWEMSQELHDPRLRFFLGDVRDKDRLRFAFQGVDVVIHAAALKQVPALEYNPFEGVQTNIHGARNVIEAAIECHVGRVVALSTDKAVNPINLYGATKLVAEKLFTHANVYGKTTFGVVRYGNVIGTRGSVVPLWMKQRETGTISITDERMTRFFYTLPDGVQFVLRCLSTLDASSINVPSMMAFALVDLASVIAPSCTRRPIGVRQGEKLHEVVRTEYECEKLGLDFTDFNSATAPRMTMEELRAGLDSLYPPPHN